MTHLTPKPSETARKIMITTLIAMCVPRVTLTLSHSVTLIAVIVIFPTADLWCSHTRISHIPPTTVAFIIITFYCSIIAYRTIIITSVIRLIQCIANGTRQSLLATQTLSVHQHRIEPFLHSNDSKRDSSFQASTHFVDSNRSIHLEQQRINLLFIECLFCFHSPINHIFTISMIGDCRQIHSGNIRMITRTNQST